MNNKEILQNYNNRLNTNNTSLNEILEIVEGLPEITEPNLQDKTVTPTEQLQEITADSNYDGLGKVSVNAIPSEYIVPSGTLEITENGEYNVGEFEKANVNIESSGGGGGSSITKGVIINSCDAEGYPTDISVVGMTEIPTRYFYYAFYATSSGQSGLFQKVGANLHLPSNLTEIGAYAFYRCQTLAITELPDSVTTIDGYAFDGDTELSLTKLPNNLKTLGDYVFRQCENITIKEVPIGVTKISAYAFRECKNITELTVQGAITSIGTYVFYGCSNLAKLVIPNVTSIPTLSNANALTSTPIASGTGYIYVPDSLVDSFKTATNWSTYANQIKGVSELV